MTTTPDAMREAAERTGLTHSDIRGLIKRHGGGFHGPRVEHLSMEEQSFWRFIDELILNERRAALSAKTDRDGWRTDFENAPSPCIGWCTPPAGDVVRQIWRHPTSKGLWTAHSITQTVKAWQPLPALLKSPQQEDQP